MAKITYLILIILYVSLNIEPIFSQTCGLSSNKLKDANKDSSNEANNDSSSEANSDTNIDSSSEGDSDHSTIPIHGVRLLHGGSSNKRQKNTGSKVNIRILTTSSYETPKSL